MAPPTATATLEEEQQQTVIKMNAAAVAPEEEDMESQLSSLSRGPNPLQGTIFRICVNLFPSAGKCWLICAPLIFTFLPIHE
jgi:hypothetical protein